MKNKYNILFECKLIFKIIYIFLCVFVWIRVFFVKCRFYLMSFLFQRRLQENKQWDILVIILVVLIVVVGCLIIAVLYSRIAVSLEEPNNDDGNKKSKKIKKNKKSKKNRKKNNDNNNNNDNRVIEVAQLASVNPKEGKQSRRVSEKGIQMITQMGFSREKAANALILCDHHVNQAIEYLLMVYLLLYYILLLIYFGRYNYMILYDIKE